MHQDMSDCVCSDPKVSEEDCKTGAAAAGGDGTTAAEDSIGVSVFAGPIGR